MSELTMDKIVALCKNRGYTYPLFLHFAKIEDMYILVQIYMEDLQILGIMDL